MNWTFYIVSILTIVNFSTKVECINSVDPDKTTKNCQDIPKSKFPPFQDFVALGSLRIDYTIDKLFNGAAVTYVNKDQGESGFSGNLLITTGSIFTVLKSTFTEDCANTSNCDTGEELTWYLQFHEATANSTYVCVFACKNEKLQEFVCASNNDDYEQHETIALHAVEDVQGSEHIHSARTETYPHFKCNVEPNK